MFEQPQQHPVHGESGKQHVTIFKMRHMLRVVSLLALALIVIVGFVALLSNYPGKARAQAKDRNSPVGVWFVDAVGATFQPHIATFHSDGTMLIDNPESGDSHTSDSAGMGPWKIQEEQGNNGDTVVGKFEEINADRTTNQFVSTLIVTFTITVTGDTFTGPAQATYYNPDGTTQAGPFPATLNGTRIQLP